MNWLALLLLVVVSLSGCGLFTEPRLHQTVLDVSAKADTCAVTISGGNMAETAKGKASVTRPPP